MKSIVMMGVAAGLAAAVTYAVVQPREHSVVVDPKNVVETSRDELIGYTNYRTHLEEGKKVLSGQMSFIAAKIRRDDVVVQKITRELVAGLGNSAVVKILFTGEYTFGYDLAPDHFDVRSAPSGIEVVLRRPTLVATPAVTNLKSQVVQTGIFMDEKADLLKLQESAAPVAAQIGKNLATDPAVVALCEKKLVEFLRGFLAKQPGVKVVPFISIVYTN